jgi:aminopeptidase N
VIFKEAYISTFKKMLKSSIMHSRFFSSTLIALVLLSCNSNKKTQSTSATKPAEPVIVQEPVKPQPKEEPRKTIYRAANTLRNDIIHTKLEVSFDWQNSRLNGKAELTLKPYFYPTNMLYLDARGMDIKSVELLSQIIEKPSKTGSKSASANTYNQKTALSYKYENDSLKINLGREITAKEEYQVLIEYVAKPNELRKGGSMAISSDKGLYFINPKGEDPNKMPQIWTQGETQSNSAWFPTVDSPNEKMTNEIFMTVDDKYTTLSNGLLVDSKKNTDGTRTDHWKMDLPHSPYLVMMGVGEFKKITDAPWNGKEISYYVEKEYEQHAKAIFGHTKEMIEFYSGKLGVPYAWPKYSQIVVRDYVSGAMENTSATLHGDFMVYQTTRDTIDGIKGEDVIAHELFHQWFGDLATSESWSNLPLNESFATYGEYLWEEYKFGRDAADEHHAHSRYGYLAQSAQKEVNLVRYDYIHREEMFDAFSYNKGGQVLHMLRKYVGDEAFFASLKLYLETRKFKHAEIHDLRLAFEEVTREDLNWFFNQWFLNKGHPRLEVTKSYDETSKILTVSVAQKHDFSEAPLYKLPVYVDIYSGGKKERKRIWIDDVKNTFTFNVGSKPELVNFDAERQLLAKIQYEKSKAEYIYQYKNAGLWGDRDEALEFFKKNIEDNEVYELVKWIAQNDKWKSFRSDAADILEKVAKSKEAEVKPLLMTIATKDANTKVRANALGVLAENYKGTDLDALYEKSLGEQSYAIVAKALEALSKTNPTVAMQKAKGLENESSKKVLFAIADLYAQNGSDEHFEFFSKVKNRYQGFELLGFVSVYGKFLKRITNKESILKGGADMAAWAKTSNQYVKFGSLKVLKSLADSQPEGEVKTKLNELYNGAK